MAYTPAGLNLLIPANTDTFNGTATANNPNVWLYNSPDALTTVQGADYFSDNGTAPRGMQLFDQVRVSVAGIPRNTLQYVSAIDADTGAATVSSAV